MEPATVIGSRESETSSAPSMSPFAKTIFEQKYAWKDDDGNITEEWEDTAKRVVTHVLGSLGYTESDEEYWVLHKYIAQRKFMPGGRYLYASGRSLHQTQNCLLLKAEDSREGWADLLSKSAMALQTGAGIGIDYSQIRPAGSIIKRTGGVASGIVPLANMINEIGRGVMQGGSRRSAIWAGLNWAHGDVFEFIRCKDWSQALRDMKDSDSNFALPMEFTNISVLLDGRFFAAYEDPDHPMHDHAMEVYKLTTTRMLRTAEPGFSIDVKENEGETLRNAPVTAKTNVLTSEGYQQVGNLVGIPISIWTGQRWANDVTFEKTIEDSPIVRVTMTGGREIRCEPSHEFLVEDWVGRGSRRKLDGIRRVPAQDLRQGDILHVALPDVATASMDKSAYTLGYIYGDGSFHQAGGADLTLCTDDSKECLPALVGASSINEEDSRGYTRLYFGVDERWQERSKAEFPTEVFTLKHDEIASFVAGLFDADGNYEPTQQRLRLSSKHRDFLRGVARALEQLGILAHISKAGVSTYGKTQTWQLVVASESMGNFAWAIPTQRLNPRLSGYTSYRRSTVKVNSVEPSGTEDVYCADVGVAEHSFMAEGVIISNCTEITSSDDSDICNLGSINLARIESLEEMKDVVKYATLFLLAGTVYSDVPYDKVDEIRQKNRRLGLGIMGVHEWLLKKGYRYEKNDELETWLEEYARSTEIAADWADQHGLNHPIKTRAIAPTGTIGIIAETTTGIEPIFCVAYKRRYLVGQTWKYQYVVDPTARRVIEEYGVDSKDIEDAYRLSYDVERRVAFQAWVQQYVDHAISSTINLPYVVQHHNEVNDFADMLYGYLPYLRGVTVYPDGARGNQPLTVSSYEHAASQEGVVFEENPSNACLGGSCGV